MKKIITLLVAYLCLSVSHAQAQNAPITEQVTLHVATAGTLQDMIDPSLRPLITNLKLTGELNGDDLLMIREMAGADGYGNPTQGYALETLDISEVTIVRGGSFYVVVNRVILGRTFRFIYSTGRYDKYSIDGLGSSWGDNYGLDYLFYQCKNIKDVKLPDYFEEERTQYANGTFIGCTSLTSIELPESVTMLSDAFIGCTSLTTIDLPESVSYLDGTFEGCTSLKTIDLSKSVEHLYLSGTFKGCTSLTQIILPESVKYLDSTFEGCTSLTQIILPKSVEHLYGTFIGCTSLNTIDLPKSVKYLDGTFIGCTSLKTIDLPIGVEHLDSTFKSCTSLNSVNIRELSGNALYLGDTFKDCPNLRTIRFFSSIPPIPSEFPELSDNVIIYVPKGSYTSYWVTGWGNYNLVEFDAVGIDTPMRTNKAGVPKYYSIEGKLLTSPQLGVNIVRKADGTTKKVFIQRP